ncbi:MAG: hypothetical protein AAF387_15440 [Pseudomonadota bacterium]
MGIETLSFEWYDAVGIFGVAIILVVYYLLQVESMKSDDLAYSVTNLLGALLIVVSLFYRFNLASFVIEICWILISLLGIYRYFQKRRSQANATEPKS